MAFKFRRAGRIEVLCPTRGETSEYFRYGVVRFVLVTGGFVLVTDKLGLACKVHILVYHSSLGSRVIKKKKRSHRQISVQLATRGPY